MAPAARTRIRTRCFALMGCLQGVDGRHHCRGGGTRAASALRRTAAGRYETAEMRDERRGEAVGDHPLGVGGYYLETEPPFNIFLCINPVFVPASDMAWAT